MAHAKDSASSALVYRDYLDKEMTIVGVLAAFATGAAALVIKEWLQTPLWERSTVCVLAGSIGMIFSALCFYLERSHLAWLYGQISLAAARSNEGVDDWIERADSWGAWFWYRTAFVLVTFSIFALACGLLNLGLIRLSHGGIGGRIGPTPQAVILSVALLLSITGWIRSLRLAHSTWPKDTLDDVPVLVQHLLTPKARPTATSRHRRWRRSFEENRRY
jgi:hypothetical protein